MKIKIELGNIASYSRDLDDAIAFAMYSNLVNVVLDKSQKDISELIGKNTNVENQKNPFTKSTFFRNRKLIAYRCPECGKITTRFMILAENNVTHCHFCKHDNIVINDVEKAEYKCESCGVTRFAYMANWLSEINCRECDTMIPLVFNKTTSRLKSANLHKEGPCI